MFFLRPFDVCLRFQASTPDKIVETVMTKVNKLGKGIILMHDFQKHIGEALPTLLGRLKAGGYKVVQMKAKALMQTIASYDAELEGRKTCRDQFEAGGRVLCRRWGIRGRTGRRCRIGDVIYIALPRNDCLAERELILRVWKITDNNAVDGRSKERTSRILTTRKVCPTASCW